jgi:hypothetical protein
MKIMRKIFEEIKIVLGLSSYFAIVFILLMVMKKLYLDDYNIEFIGLSQALIGALILAKVVLLMELIKPAKWVRRQPPIVDVIFRTLLYTMGVAIVMVLEKSFEKRHEAGSFGDAIIYIVSHRDFYHVWATTIGVSGSLFAYNAFSILQHMLGKNGLMKLFFHTSLDQVEHATLTEKNLSFGLK